MEVRRGIFNLGLSRLLGAELGASASFNSRSLPPEVCHIHAVFFQLLRDTTPWEVRINSVFRYFSAESREAAWPRTRGPDKVCVSSGHVPLTHLASIST